MRQADRLVVAPVNDNPRWPQGYVEALRRAGAQEKTIPYCISWVRKFFARNPGARRRDLGRVEIEAFLSELCRSGVANRKVQQARDSLETYYEQFRGIALAPRPELPQHGPVEPTNNVSHDIPPHNEAVQPKPSVRLDSPTDRPCGNDGFNSSFRKPVDKPKVGRNSSSVSPGVSAEKKTDWKALEAKVRECLRVGHYSYRTEQTYLMWIRRFLDFHQWRRPSTMEAKDVGAFLKHLAEDRQVASSTQNQALNSVIFLFKQVLKKELGDFSDFVRARRGMRLPVVAGRNEIKAILEGMTGREHFMAVLLYGTGMRINELLRLRVQDVDFDQNRLIVRGGKGDRDRYVPLPGTAKKPLKEWLTERMRQYVDDKSRGMHEVEVPGALAMKYPNAPYEWRWQYIFAADKYSKDPRSGHVRRHHLDEQVLQRAVRDAVRRAGLTIRFTPHCFRHSFATHLIEAGQDIHTVQKLLGHQNVETTQIYTHVLNKGPMGVISPADTL